MTTAVSLASLGSVITAPVGSAPSYTCRAWVNFNGTGTVAIRASGNVSSITDNGTGDYTVNFTTAMPDSDYSIGGSTGYSSDYYGAAFLAPDRNASNGFASAPTTTYCRVNSQRYDGNASDALYASVIIFR